MMVNTVDCRLPAGSHTPTVPGSTRGKHDLTERPSVFASAVDLSSTTMRCDAKEQILSSCESTNVKAAQAQVHYEQPLVNAFLRNSWPFHQEQFVRKLRIVALCVTIRAAIR